MTDGEMTAELEPAGFRFVERVLGGVRWPALPPGYSPASAGPEHGRFDSRPDEIADVDEPGMADKVNASWYRMAVEYGLFSKEREFFLAVDFSMPDDDDVNGEHRGWARVRLLDEWDVVRSEVDQFRSPMGGLLTERFVPEFTVVSLDSRVLLNTTVWGNGTVSTIAIRP
ncbi:hypothetical protein ACFU9Y_46585 [Streptomyces sp. NPDC057621]|uniref:hypothetical protein n=1 Tax=Streptomyces sp. NPDC057621 TaxID=3346186 RepID=UPI0036B2E7D2